MLKNVVLIFSFFTSVSWAELPKFSVGNFPIIQTATSDTEAQFNTLVPRLQNFAMKAYPLVDGVEGAPLKAEVLFDGVMDPDKILHEKVMRFRIQGMDPKAKYRLELLEVSNFGEKVVEQRYFKTLNPLLRSLKYALISCISDEKIYAEARAVLWKKIETAALDVIFLLGDMTYVDDLKAVSRKKITVFDVWLRTFTSFKANPLAYQETLTPTQFTWDDHDAGIDNANKDFPLIKEAARATEAIYGGNTIPGVVEYAKEGLQKIFKWAGQYFIFLDNRSFRSARSETDVNGHLGAEQKSWLLSWLRKIGDSAPAHIMIGNMLGSPTVQKKLPDGKIKNVTESYFGDHPADYIDLFRQINSMNVTLVAYSGDIHFTQVVEHGPREKGTSRYSPTTFLEVTSSPMHSFIFEPTKDEPQFWPDPQRILAYRGYNFVIADSQWVADKKELKLQLTGVGMPDKPVFNLGTTISRNPVFLSQRRRLLAKGFSRVDKKVKVAFFDADATLRVAPSGGVTAKHETDVYILPGVAEEIAELNRRGFLVAIVSNQGGIDRGAITFEKAEKALRLTMDLIRKENPAARIHYFDMAEQDSDDFYRKPDIGMMKHLERVLARNGYALDWANSFMVGDAQYKSTDIHPRTGKPGEDFTNTDRLVAENAGIPPIHPADFFGWSPEQLAAVRKNDVEFLSGGKVKSTRPKFPEAKNCSVFFK